jgi:hypothetical protein
MDVDTKKPVCDMNRKQLMDEIIWHDDEKLRRMAFEAFLKKEHDEELRILVREFRAADRAEERRLVRNFQKRMAEKAQKGR